MEILTRYRLPLTQAMDSLLGGPPSPILAMCRYHLGLADVYGAPTHAAAGKMLRPALCLAMCEALGGDPHRCLPAALSLEVTHRTSLVFDDIQDHSPRRNDRPTIWGVWGVDQAINAGLALSCYARLALHHLEQQGVSPETTLEVQRVLEETVLELCSGQFLDLHCQDQFPTLDRYLEMVRLKTGVLLATACEVGAIVAGTSKKRKAAGKFGESLGMAFQLQDDILGVWGEASLLGKEPNDLEERKAGLPLVLLSSHRPELQRMSTESLYQALEVNQIREQAEVLKAGFRQEALAAVERLDIPLSWHLELEDLVEFVTDRNQ